MKKQNKGNGISKATIKDLVERGRKIGEKYHINLTLEDMLVFVEMAQGSNYELFLISFEVGLEKGFRAGFTEGWRRAQESWEE